MMFDLIFNLFPVFFLLVLGLMIWIVVQKYPHLPPERPLSQAGSRCDRRDKTYPRLLR